METGREMNGNTDVLSAQPPFPPPKTDFDRAFEDTNAAAAVSNATIDYPPTAAADGGTEPMEVTSSFTDSAPGLSAPSDLASSVPSSSAMEQQAPLADAKVNIFSEPLNGITSDTKLSTTTPPPEESLKPIATAPSPQAPLQMESAPAPTQPSLPSRSVTDSNAPDHSNTPPVQSSDLPSSLPPPIEQAPTSNLRTSPRPEPLDSNTVQEIKSDKHQEDLANDTELAQGLANGDQASIERQVTPPPESTEDVVPPTDSVDAPISAEPPSEPPPAPVPAPAILPSEPLQAVPAIPTSEAQSIAAPTAPAETPTEPAPTPALPVASSDIDTDQSMTDAPPPPTKIARDREEDEEAEPAAKRPKTTAEEDVGFKVPDVPQTASSEPPEDPMSMQPNADSDDPDRMTDARYTFVKRQVQSLKKLKAAVWFSKPVDYVALNIPHYPEIIKQPIALSDIDDKLKTRQYKTVTEIGQDLDLMVANARTFNGPEHKATKDAESLRASFDNYMQSLPPATIPEPSRQEKKVQKSKEQPTRSVPVRKPSTTSLAPAGSPTGSAADRFALAPGGIPTIRRDSTAVGDRPKRAIKPSKARLDIGGARPRKKKFETQLKFCKHVLDILKKNKYWNISQYFLEPVDPVALNIPSYHSVIKKPMDMHTMENKLNDNQYEKAKDFEEDFRLIFKNCYRFNVEGDVVWTAGKQFEQTFEELWNTKDSWIEQHEPVSGPQTPSDDSDAAASEEEGDEDGGDSESERQQKLEALQKQIEAMSKQMGELANPKKKKKPTPPAPSKKASKSSKPVKKESKSAGFPGLTKEKKKAVKQKPEKERMVTYNEKQYISTGISSLNDAQMMDALRIIQNNVPRLKDVDESEIELDIDELPNGVLLKLLNFLKKHIPQAPPEPPSEPTYMPKTTSAAPSRPKKNKPMSKHEQEARIAELTGKLNTYGEGTGNHTSPDPEQSIEHGGASSGDEDDSEESEEE
ncbi:MAG: hypothetical protein Q9227_002612 [Pyrenula ochraceoflavens]